MIKIGIQEKYNNYEILKEILLKHYVPFKEGSIFNEPLPYENENIIILYNLTKDVQMIQIQNNNSGTNINKKLSNKKINIDFEFDIILISDISLTSNFNFNSKVCIMSSSTFQDSNIFNKIIYFGFDKKAHVTYSSIMEKNNTTYLIICIQNTFKTLYDTKMIKFEFLITSDIKESILLDSLLGIITLCLFLDLRFENNENICFKGENVYVK